MTNTPIWYINNPSSGTEYWGKLWAGVISSGESLSAVVTCYAGANGAGGTVVVSSLTAVLWDQTTNTQRVSYTGNGIYGATTTASSTTANDWYKGAVVYNGSGVGSIGIYLQYTASAPFVPTAPTFSPASGGPGTVVTLTGTHFTDATFVNFNGVAASSFTFVSDTQVTAVVPTGATTGVITIGNPAGSANSAASYLISQAWVNTGTPASPVWTSAIVYANTGTPASPVWTVAAQVADNTGTPASPVWTPGG